MRVNFIGCLIKTSEQMHLNIPRKSSFSRG